MFVHLIGVKSMHGFEKCYASDEAIGGEYFCTTSLHWSCQSQKNLSALIVSHQFFQSGATVCCCYWCNSHWCNTHWCTDTHWWTDTHWRDTYLVVQHWYIDANTDKCFCLPGKVAGVRPIWLLPCCNYIFERQAGQQAATGKWKKRGLIRGGL